MIRSARQTDCQKLAELHVASWRDAYADILPKEFLDMLNVDKRSAGWKRVLGSSESKVFLHFNESNLVGFSAICPSRDEDGEGVGEIGAIYYRKYVWGAGLASELMKVIQTELLDAGFRKVTLWVFRENARAQAFYKKHGFAADGTERKFERGTACCDEIRMARS